MLDVAELMLVGGSTLTPDGWTEQSVVIADGKVVDSLPNPACPVLDVGGLSLVPGFIDLQINGGWGLDLQDRPEDVWLLAAKLPSIGVTSFLPTLTTDGFATIERAVAALADGPPDGWRGADPIGWHLEGPWLAPAKAGAHDAAAMRPPPSVGASLPFTSQDVRLVTVAPELTGATDLISRLVGEGMTVSLGHTAADLPQARAGVDAGATMGTHLFNAMDGLHHRRPGLAAAMLLDDMHVGLIADGHHVLPEMVDMAWRLAGERIVLVSDAVASLGQIADPVSKLPDGTLAGAVVGLDQAVRNLMTFAGADLAQACRAASAAPARAIGLDDRGRLWSGMRADIVALDPQHRVVFAMIGGEIVSRHQGLGGTS